MHCRVRIGSEDGYLWIDAPSSWRQGVAEEAWSVGAEQKSTK